MDDQQRGFLMLILGREVFDANTWLRGFWCWYLSRIKTKRKRNPAVHSRNYDDFNDPQKDDDEVYDDDENLVEEIRNSNLRQLGGGNSRWVAGTTNKAGNWRVRAVGWWEEDVEQLFSLNSFDISFSRIPFISAKKSIEHCQQGFKGTVSWSSENHRV